MKSVIFWFQAACGSVLFTGYFPVAPATVSSLFALIPAYFLSCRPLVSALVIIPVFFFGVWIAGDLEKVWGKDPRRVTIDELAGTLITFFGLPVSLAGLLVGLLVWRFFDIVKLPFIRKSQELPGGWGVMIDDVLAGICANLVLRVLVLFFPVLRRG